MAERDPYFLVLGLDYGTSYSKMVIREVDQNRSATVTNRQGHCLFPSVFGFREDCLYAPLCDPCPNAVPFLKMSAPQIAFDGKEATSEALKALLETPNRLPRIKSILAWQFCIYLVAALDFLKERSPWSDYDSQKDILFINLGLPIEYFRREDIQHLFLGALAAARDLAPQCDLLISGNARIELAEWEEYASKSIWPTDDPNMQTLYLYPEVAAGAQSVMRSATAQDGLYITLDVGSGTLDANSFRKHTAAAHEEDCPNLLSYYAARVSRLGVSYLSNEAGQHIFQEFPHLISDTTKEATTESRQPDQFFLSVNQEMRALQAESLLKQPNRGMAPNRTWDKCRIYGFGGGIHHNQYRQILDASMQTWVDSATITNLPVPSDLKMPENADYSRLAIAYGLSFPIENLETIIPPRKLNLPPSTPNKLYLPQKPGDPGFSTLDQYEM
jgi:hypothetical protein